MLTMDGCDCGVLKGLGRGGEEEKKKANTRVLPVSDRGRRESGRVAALVVWLSCCRDLECCIELHN